MEYNLISKREELISFILESEEKYDDKCNLRQSISIKLVNIILDYAIEFGISDIHFEPLETIFKIRFRKEGNLFDFLSLDLDYYVFVVNIIKMYSKLDITEIRKPQEGRFSRKLNEKDIDIRVSITQVYQGEKIVLRILDNKNFNFNLNNIGLGKDGEEHFEKVISKKYGLILIVGPTGSGKTTTAYTIMKKLNNEFKNIYSIEDPVEYLIPGINQIEYCEGNKNEILKYLLRQDFDMIFLGELRDKISAKLAFEASLSGHLVIATIHGFNTKDALLRLKEMGISDSLLLDCIISISSQILVKTLCDKCKIKKDEYYENNGCSKCINGYSNRIAIHEILKLDDLYRENILNGIYTTNYNYLKKYATELNKSLKEGIIDEKEYFSNL